MTQNLIKIVASNGKPTLYFLVHEAGQQLILFDRLDNKKLHYKAFESFKLNTIDIFYFEL